MNDDKLTDDIIKGSEDENNHSVGTVDSPYYNSNEGANKAEEKSSTSNQHIGKNFLQYPTIMISKNCKSIPENWLELEILALLKCRMKIDRFGLYNNDGKQVCICTFIEEYEKRSNFIRYFSRPIFYSFSSKVFGDMIRLPTTVEEGCKKLSNEVRFDNLDIFGPHLSMAIKEVSDHNSSQPSHDHDKDQLEQQQPTPTPTPPSSTMAMERQLTLDGGSVQDSTQSQSQPSPRNDGKIYRSNAGSDIWLCEMCNARGDRWFLEEHWCSRNLKKSRK
jgi:hypothetical protein